MSSRLNDRIEQILLDERIEPIILHQATLREPSANMSVVVVGIERRTTAIHVDGLALSGLEEGDWNQKCDYLLIVNSGAVYCAVFIELKKTLTYEEKPLEQLRHSLPFLEYLRSLCRIHFEDGTPPEVEVRYAVIAERGQPRLDKQAVKATPGQPAGPGCTVGFRCRLSSGRPFPWQRWRMSRCLDRARK